jgi:hypothetical protein
VSPIPPCISAWLEFLNTQQAPASAAFLDGQIVIHAYQEGPDGPPREIKGIAAVEAWVQFPPEGHFFFQLLDCSVCPPHPSIPAAEATFQAHYEVRHVDGEFTNQGVWIAGLRKGRLLGLIHTPKGLD